MIVACVIFIVSLLLTIVCLAEFIPSWSYCQYALNKDKCMRQAMLNLLFWFIITLFSAQYIWG